MYCWIWVISFFHLLLFWGGERGEEEGGGFLTHTASQPSLWAGLSLPYATLLQRFFHFLSAKCLLFSIPRRFVCLLGGLVVGKEQDRAGQGIGQGMAGQGMAGQRGISFFFLFSFFFLLLPSFCFQGGFFFPEGGGEGFSFLFG